MFGKIIPIRKLSRNLDVFDYKVNPENQPGDLVAINFKGQDIQGVVEEIHNTQPKFKVKNINSTLKKKYFSKKQLDAITKTAKLAFISPGTLLDTTSRVKKLAESKNTVSYTYKASELKELKTLLEKQSEIETSKRHQLAIISMSANKFGETLVICPNKETLEELSVVFSDKNIKIGLRSELLKPLTCKSIILFEASHPDLELTNQNPHFSTEFLAMRYEKELEVKLFVTGEALDVKQFQNVVSFTDSQIAPILVNLPQERRADWSKMLAKTTEMAIEETLQSDENVLIFANAKGSENDFGKDALIKHLKEISPFKPHLDRIKVVTEQDLRQELMQPEEFGLIIDLAFDLHQQNALNGEHQQRFKLFRLLYGAAKDSKVIIQTFSPELVTKLLSPDYHQNSVNELERLALPPYSGALLIQKGKKPLPTGALPLNDKKYILYYNYDTWNNIYKELKSSDHNIHHLTPNYANSCTT